MNIFRQCVCGVPIPANRCLCHNCSIEYTLKRDLWPEWLRVWMQNYQAEIDYERNKDDVSIEEFAE